MVPMDPFSAITGAAGLIDVCWKAFAYLKRVEEAAGKVEGDIATLSQDIQELVTVHQSILDVFKSNRTVGNASASDGVAARVESLWGHTGAILRDCRATILMLLEILEAIVGKDGAKVVGKWDGIKKALRKQSNDSNLSQIRLRLTNNQASLQVVLTAINLLYTRNSHESTGQLSDSVYQLRFQLQHQLDLLRGKITAEHGDVICNSLSAATAPLLADLKNHLDLSNSSQIQKRFVIYGLGGSGKTQFCCKFAQDNRDSFWGIFHIDGSSRENAAHSYSTIAQIGGLAPNERAGRNWLSTLDRPWMLLIDNVDDPTISLEDLFPPGQRGFILVTTRVPSNKVHGTIGVKFYHFEKLEHEEAKDLLLKAASTPRPWTLSTRESAARIAQALGNLPLALIHAGKAIMDGLCSLENYLDFYERTWKRIRRARSRSTSRDPGGIRGDESDENETINMNVYSSYEIIYLGLEAKKTVTSDDAIELLKVFSFLYWEKIQIRMLVAAAQNPKREEEAQEKEDKEKSKIVVAPHYKPKTWAEFFKEIAAKITEPLQRDNSKPVLPAVLRNLNGPDSFDIDRLRIALKVLTQMSMITHHEGDDDTLDSYSMHPLVHTWVRERPQISTGEQAIWCQAATNTLAQSILLPPLGSTEADEAFRRDILFHVVHVQKCEKEIHGRIVDNQKTRKSMFPIPQPQLSRCQVLQYAKFSMVYSQSGFWEEAEQLQLAVKNFLVPRLGMEHPITQRVVLALSSTLWQQTRANEAAELQNEVLQACLRSLGPDHPRTLKVTDDLGVIRCLQGRFYEAEALHRRAVEGMEDALGQDHEDTLLAIDNLGRVMFKFFSYNEAREYHEKAITGMNEVLGPTNLKTLSAKESLAMALMELGGELLDRAHELMEEVHGNRRKKLGKEHPYTMLAISNLAQVKTAMGRTDEAEALLLKTLPIAERNLGENHIGVIAGHCRLAQNLVRQKRFEEAEKIYSDILERHRYAAAARDDGTKRLDDDHPDRIMAMYWLTDCYQEQGKIKQAIVVCDQLAYILRNARHPIVQKVRDRGEELRKQKSDKTKSQDRDMLAQTADR